MYSADTASLISPSFRAQIITHHCPFFAYHCPKEALSSLETKRTMSSKKQKSLSISIGRWAWCSENIIFGFGNKHNT